MVVMIMMTAVVGQSFRYLGLGVGWLRVLASLVAGQGPGVVSPGDSELRQLSLPHSLD